MRSLSSPISGGLFAAAIALGLAGAFGCGGKDGGVALAATAKPPSPDSLSPAVKAEAAQLFSSRCARCHGALGKGDGPNASTLKPRPRNFSDPTWQLAVSDSHLDKVIQYGGAAVGKSAAMPANPDIAKRPELLVALRQHLRVLALMP